MQRVALVGSGGAGKSTLARRLGEILGLEVVHLDALHWRPGWTAPPPDEWAKTVAEAAGRERWIIDGNYGGTLDLRFARADTIVFLDFPRILCVFRALQRALRYWGRQRPDMGPGCPEKIDWEFVKWIWNYPKRSRPAMLARLERFREGRQIFVLRSPRQVRRFLARLAGQNIHHQYETEQPHTEQGD